MPGEDGQHPDPGQGRGHDGEGVDRGGRGYGRPRFCLGGRPFLAARLHRLPWEVPGRFRLLIRRPLVIAGNE